MNKNKTEHQKMIQKLCKDTSILASALGLDSIWVRGDEYVIDSETKEKADLIFQDKFDPRKINPNTNLYVLELKSNKGDHEILGQLQKSVDIMKKIGRATSHWHHVHGVAIARTYTVSGMKLLNDNGYKTLQWSDGNVTLREIGDSAKADTSVIVRKAFKRKEKND